MPKAARKSPLQQSSTKHDPMKIAVLLGSVRSERMGLRVARYVMDRLRERGHRPVLVDAAEQNLPLLDKMYKELKGNVPPAQKPLQAKLKKLARLYTQTDGFVIVSAEYNHSVPPALTNLLDYFLEEYFFRPSAIVCYSAGQFGGVRAAMQLRALLAEIGMPSVPSLLPIANVQQALTEDGKGLTKQLAEGQPKFFDEVEWYMRAFKAERARAPLPY